MDDDEQQRKKYSQGREWWFHFEEGEAKKKQQASLQSDKDKEKEKEKEEIEEQRRHWLGKPKQEDKNYRYVIMEWEGHTRNATVYPATFIEFGLSTQLVADGQASAETAEKRHRQQLEKWRKKQAEKSVMEKLGNLFGHDQDGNIKQKKKKLRADEMTDESKEKLKSMYMDRIDITNEEWEMLKDLLGQEQFELFNEEYQDHQKDKRNKKSSFGLVTGDDEDRSLIKDKILSKRLKANKTRGQLDELNDFDEFMSDDEDETNLNNYDRIDDHEQDIMSDDDGNESEKDETFKKLEKNIDQDITTKEYQIPKKDKKNEFEQDSDVDDEGDKIWNISDDDSDDDDDDDDINDMVKINRKKKGNNNNNNNNKNNKNNNNKKKKKKNSKKRKFDNDNKGGPNAKKRKLNAEDEKKLKEELTDLITKILKKHPDGLAMYTLWGKITASLSAEQSAIKAVLSPVFKKLIKVKNKDGKKIYCLKKEFK